MATIWERSINHERIAARNRRATRWFLVPSLSAAVLGFWAGGVGLGVALVLASGFLASLLAMFVMSSNRNERMNPSLETDNGDLVLGVLRVPMKKVECFTTYMGSARTNVGSAAGEPTGDGAPVAKVMLRFVDGDGGLAETVFGWPKMSAEELESVRTAIESQLPGQWLSEPEYNSLDQA